MGRSCVLLNLIERSFVGPRCLLFWCCISKGTGRFSAFELNLLSAAPRRYHKPCCARHAVHSFNPNRSPSMLKSLETHRPWTEAALATPEQPRDPRENEKYVAWQIRTTDGESSVSYVPQVHKYIFDHVPSTEVCPWYFTAMEEALGACRGGSDGDAMPIFVSSNRCV